MTIKPGVRDTRSRLVLELYVPEFVPGIGHVPGTYHLLTKETVSVGPKGIDDEVRVTAKKRIRYHDNSRPAQAKINRVVFVEEKTTWTEIEEIPLESDS